MCKKSLRMPPTDMAGTVNSSQATIVLEGINAVVPEVLQTMTGLPARQGKGSLAVPLPLALQGVSGSIGLSGRTNGIVYTAFGKNLAASLAAKILGSVSSEQDLSDVVAELTNMISGNLKSRFSDAGFNCTLTIPSVVTGDNISINPKNSSMNVGNAFLVEGSPEPLCVYFFGFFDK
jgi:chemotaxis protein CheX